MASVVRKGSAQVSESVQLRCAVDLSSGHRVRRPDIRNDPNGVPGHGMSLAARSLRLPTSFHRVLRRSPPPVPPSLLRFNSEPLESGLQARKKDVVGQGRVKVLLRVCPSVLLGNGKSIEDDISCQSSSRDNILHVEGNRKQVTIYNSTGLMRTAHERVGVSAPKVYAFDSVFPEDSSQAEVNAVGLVGVIHALVQGADGAIFCYGQTGLGKTHSLIGSDTNVEELGMIPCGVSWLFRFIGYIKEKTKRRYSVRVSAIEIHGRSEKLKDLLKDIAKDDAPSEEICVTEDAIYGTQLKNQCLLRASTMEKAAYMLDVALAARSSSGSRATEEARRHSHLVYTLHLHQHTSDQTNASGVGRSRLHFIDLGSCERTLVKTPKSLTLSLNSLGHVIMAIINNSKHVPFKESKLTMILQELLGNFNCRAVMVAHVADRTQHYADTLSTIQMASRIHRVITKRKNKSSTRSCSLMSIDHHVPEAVIASRSKREDEETRGNSSGIGETSGSEISCDTVIYVRPNGLPYSDKELTDNEAPPRSVPIRTTQSELQNLAAIKGDKSKISRSQITSTKDKCTVETQNQMSKGNVHVCSVKSNVGNQGNIDNRTGRIRKNNISKLPRPVEKRGKKESELDSDKTSINRSEAETPCKYDAVSQKKSNDVKKSKIPPPPRRNGTRIASRSIALQEKHRGNNKAMVESTTTKANTSGESVMSRRTNGIRGEDPIKSTNLTQSSDTSTFANNTDGIPSRTYGLIRQDPDGCDVMTKCPPKSSRTGTSIVNLSYCDVTLSRSPKKQLKNCIAQLNNVVRIMEKDKDMVSLKDKVTPYEDSSASETTTDTGNNSSEYVESSITECGEFSEDDENVIRENFYCLHFNSKNPLVPLSKCTYSQQVLQNRRRKMKATADIEKGLDTSTGNDDMRWATKLPEACDELVIQNVEETEEEIEESLGPNDSFEEGSSPCCAQNKDIPEMPAPSNSDSGSCTVVSHTSIPQRCKAKTRSSLSQVLLYDSSSLVMNYVKSKSSQNSFADEDRQGHPFNQSSEYHSNSSLKITQQPIEIPGREVVISGSGCNSGPHLSLVKGKGDSSTLELVITASDGTETSRTNTDRSQSSEAAGHKSKSKWGIKRFGTKKQKDKIPEGSLSAGNRAIESVKSSHCNSQRFVSKLLSPKTKRKSKKSDSSISTDSNVRSRNVPSIAKSIVIENKDTKIKACTGRRRIGISRKTKS